MVSSDAAAFCVCPWIFRATNKIYLHFTQWFLYIFHKTMYNNWIDKCNRPRLITLASTLIIPDITKTSSNYCLKLQVSEANTRPVHTTLEESVSTALFYTVWATVRLIRHENGAFRKRFSNRRNLKSLGFRFHVHGKHLNFFKALTSKFSPKDTVFNR